MPLQDEGDLHPEQVAALKAMSGVERIRLGMKLYWDARAAKAAGLRMQHPN